MASFLQLSRFTAPLRVWCKLSGFRPVLHRGNCMIADSRHNVNTVFAIFSIFFVLFFCRRLDASGADFRAAAAVVVVLRLLFIWRGYFPERGHVRPTRTPGVVHSLHKTKNQPYNTNKNKSMPQNLKFPTPLWYNINMERKYVPL